MKRPFFKEAIIYFVYMFIFYAIISYTSGLLQEMDILSKNDLWSQTTSLELWILITGTIVISNILYWSIIHGSLTRSWNSNYLSINNNDALFRIYIEKSVLFVISLLVGLWLFEKPTCFHTDCLYVYVLFSKEERLSVMEFLIFFNAITSMLTNSLASALCILGIRAIIAETVFAARQSLK